MEMELSDEELLKEYIEGQKEGRINPIEVSPAIDMKTNPRLTPPQAGEKLLPTEEKSEYWREELRRGKSPKDVLNQYLMDRLTQNERQISPSYIKDLSTDRKEDFKNQRVMDLMKSGADFGASFANQRWRSPQGEVPVSGFKPENIKGEMKEFGQDLTRERGRYDNVRNIDQKVLQYLAEQQAKQELMKQKAEEAEKDRALRLKISKLRAENDPMKELMLTFKQAEENRQKGEYQMQQEKHQAAMEKAKTESLKEDELVSRYRNQIRNLEKLQEIVDKTSFYETNPLTEGVSNIFSKEPTAHASEIDKTIYDLALDYAKIVDPQSVAREGEVAAAEKYALPIKFYLSTGQKKVAKQLIEQHKKDIESRVMSSTKSGILPSSKAETVKIQAPDGSIRTVPASSAKKYLDKGGKIVE